MVEPYQKTAPFELGGGETACLLLHGFSGSPWDVRPLAEDLAERGHYVRAILLPGHGTTPEALLEVTRRDWEQAAEAALFSLESYKRVFRLGLSAGALLAAILAGRYPERVHGLALLAPALRFKSLGMRLFRPFRHLSLIEKLKPYVRKMATDIEDADVRGEAPVLSAFPTARLGDLWDLQDEARQALPALTAPTLVAAARKDHVVQLRGAEEAAHLLRAARQVRFVILEHGCHIMPRDRGKRILLREVGAFFEQLSH